MELAVTIFATDRTISVVELAQAAEERAFGALFLPEHTHIPTSRRTPFPFDRDGELPPEYKRALDPFVGLTAAAAATTRIIVGTGVCLVAQHDPISLAKQVASLDLISGGRLVFGVGFGWNIEEMEAHGIDPTVRRAIVREKVEAMTALWRDDVASYSGRHVHIPESWSWPKPIQRPRPQVLLGGAAGPSLFRHVVEWADGWIPLGGAGALEEKLAALRACAADAGRDPTTIEVDVFGARPDSAALHHYRSLGVRRAVLWLPAAPRDEVLRTLDSYASLVPVFPAAGIA